MMLAKNRRKVAVVERYTDVGGGCTHWGTIPSKALRHAVKTLSDLRANPLLKEAADSLQVTFPQLLSTASSVIDAQVQMRRRFYDRNHVPVLEGSASLVDANTVRITPQTGAALDVRADRIVIATGSRPYHPPDLDFSHPHVRDSDTCCSTGDTVQRDHLRRGVIGCSTHRSS
jgi:NAD(P) transhydrogenase